LAEFWNELAIIFILIGINAFFAASEIALVTIRPTRVKQLIKEGTKSAHVIEKLLKDPSRLLASIQIGVTLAGFLASAAAAVSISKILVEILVEIPALKNYAQGIAVTTVTIIISYITLVLGELAPKRIAIQKAERISLLVARPVDFVARITGPFIAFLTLSTNLVVKLFGGEIKHREPAVTEEEIRMMVAEQKDLEEEEKELIQGIFEFGDTVAREVMVPRTEMVSLESGLSVDLALKKLSSSGYSRYPVFEKNVDNIIGIVTVKDLINALMTGQGDQKIKDLKREVHFIPESKRILDLLKELQSRRIHLAIVLDEYGGTAGLVTMEDLLEEIVGEIDDEHNVPCEPIIMVSENKGIFDGRVMVEDVNEVFSIDLPVEESYDSIGGLFFHYIGKKPKVGDLLDLDGVLLKVIEMDRNRIKKVEVTIVMKEPVDAS